MRRILDLAWAMRPYLGSRISHGRIGLTFDLGSRMGDAAYLGSRVDNAVLPWISDLAWAIQSNLKSRVDNAVLPWISYLASAVRYLPRISR